MISIQFNFWVSKAQRPWDPQSGLHYSTHPRQSPPASGPVSGIPPRARHWLGTTSGGLDCPSSVTPATGKHVPFRFLAEPDGLVLSLLVYKLLSKKKAAQFTYIKCRYSNSISYIHSGSGLGVRQSVQTHTSQAGNKKDKKWAYWKKLERWGLWEQLFRFGWQIPRRNVPRNLEIWGFMLNFSIFKCWQM